jgi:hypothetical protein
MASGGVNAGPAATKLEKGINKTVSEYFTGSACSESAGKAPTVRAKNAALSCPMTVLFANVWVSADWRADGLCFQTG